MNSSIYALFMVQDSRIPESKIWRYQYRLFRLQYGPTLAPDVLSAHTIISTREPPPFRVVILSRGTRGENIGS